MEEEAEEEEAEMDQSLAGLGNRSMDGTCESVDGSSAKSGQDLDSDLEEEEEGSDLLTQHLVSPQAPSDGRLRAGQPTLLGSPIPKMEEARHFLDDDADDDEEEDGEEDDDGAGADASSWGSGGGGPPLSGTPGVSLCANCGNTSCCGKAGQAVARSSVAHMSTQTDEDYFSSRESSNGSVELTDSDLGANAPIERGEWGSNAWPLRSTLLDGIVDPGAALYHRRRLSAPESSRPVSREEMERVAGSSQRGSGAASGGAASRTHSGSSSSFSGRVDGFARERRSSTFSERRSSTFSERRSSTSTTDGLSRVASSSSMVERRLSVPHTIMLMADTLPLPRAAAASSASFHAHAQPRPVCVPRDAHPSRAMHAVDAAHKWADAHASHNYAGPSRPGSSEEQRRPLPPMPEPSSTEQLLQEVQRAAVHAIDVHVRERRKSLACTPWTVTPHPAPARTSSGAYAPPSRPASSSSSAEAAAQGPYRLRTRQRSLEDMGSSAAAAERAAEHRPAPPRASRSRSVSNIFLDATDGAAMIL
ncbi:hypothetical protein T484DRAFT_1931465 [Baffinella frigidus]|nr:hypothetical protein T484DRAFT_1931465 [Cryptophyta sp. CCMP2293]